MLKNAPSRDKILKEIIKQLDGKKNVCAWIYGGKGLGKTYLLEKLKEKIVEKQDYIVVQYRFDKYRQLTLDDWISTIMKQLPPVKTELTEEDPRSLFEHILVQYTNPECVDSPKKVVLLLDDLYNINTYESEECKYYTQFYQYLHHLYNEISNVSIVAVTLRRYTRKKSAGSSFFLNCRPIEKIVPFDKADLVALLDGFSKIDLHEIEYKTGGYPKQVLDILEMFDEKKLHLIGSKAQLRHYWNEIEKNISVEKYIHHLNEDEREVLAEIALEMEYDNYIDRTQIKGFHKNRRVVNKIIEALKETSLVEEKGVRGVRIKGEILRKKILDEEYHQFVDIRKIIDDGREIKDNFNYLGIRRPDKIKEWILDSDNRNFVALFEEKIDFRPLLIAKEIAALANTYSGVICFGLDDQGIPVSNGLNKEFLEQKVKEAIQCLDSVKPDYQWGSFFTHGIEIRCLLIKKSMQKLTIDGETFIKSGGYPSIESENDQFLNPDHYELSRTGYIFLLRLHRYELKKKVESRKYIPFDRAILENKGNIRLFMEWIEENRGESVMIEFKGEISRNPEKQDHTRKQIVAMANTSSGVLICGIIEQPDGTIEIKGIKNPDDEQKFIFSLVNNPKMSKNVCGELQEIQYNKKTLVLYFIRKPLEPARYAKDIYKRNGRQKEKVPTERWRHFLVDHFDRGSTGYVILEEFMKWKQKRSYQ